MRGLIVAALVGEVGDQVYQATAITQHVAKPPVQAGIINFFDAGLKSLAAMPDYFKPNGYKCPEDGNHGPLQYAFDTKPETYEYWATEQPEFFENFNVFKAGKLSSTKTGQKWNESYPVKEIIIDGFDASRGDGTFVDIAGGFGHEIALLKKNFPDAPGRFVLEEIPAVIKDIKELNSSIERIEYDFFTPQPVIGARTYFMANIMHNWTDKECRQIIVNTVPAMIKGYSKFLFSDHIIPKRNCPLHTVGLDIGMLSLHSGGERSEKQWEFLFEPTGLKIVKFYRLGGGEGLIETTLKD